MAKRQKVPCNTSNPLIHLDKGTHLWQDLLGNAGCRKPFCPQQTAHLYAGKLIPRFSSWHNRSHHAGNGAIAVSKPLPRGQFVFQNWVTKYLSPNPNLSLIYFCFCSSRASFSVCACSQEQLVLSMCYADPARWDFPNRLTHSCRMKVKIRCSSAYLSASRALCPGLLQSSQEVLCWELLLLKVQAAFTAWQGRHYPPVEQINRGESFFFCNIYILMGSLV
ncbi:uncharacterized protein LOC128853453 isoform X1 [Cuculus canorus]|uniref:uncharacterized protein LOC128853453 isoform X1 n=1 Tax=Cuculus canorus TaxID=55661 RepID=UPI0023AAC2E7|nr:uncharacterized protein LOC128853453 isoform X1 [Cuculus canorus]XP_053934322.1 uncharacterized protein LOC128853453 isoform X1 [Cuculus canorus]